MAQRSPDNGERIDAIADTYARALFEAVEPAGALDEVAGEMTELRALLAEHPNLAAVFENRTIDPGRRAESIDRLFADRVHKLTLRFLHVVNRHQRLDHLGTIAAAFDRRVKEHRGQVDVEVYTAHELGPDRLDAVADRISKAIGRQALVHPHTDRSLIGGLKVRVEGKVIDASVAAQLRRMSRKIVREGHEAVRQRFDEIVKEEAEVGA